jgi:secreted PhoX family phosphatase
VTLPRRDFLRRSALYAGGAVIAPSLSGLVSCSRPVGAPPAPGRGPALANRSVRVAARGEGGYGPLASAGPDLALPRGFAYTRLSVRGQPMADGNATPSAFDGMAAFPLPNGNVRLVRNHEVRDSVLGSKAFGDPAKAYDPKGHGGTTSLEVRVRPDGTRELVRDFVSLGGTALNCAGGPTPWGSWLTCEEIGAGTRDGWGKSHGYVFEVPAAAEGQVEAVPLKAMGRFVHEAVAVDPATSIVYETEDRLIAGFYRFIPRTPRRLADGGRLEMLAVRGRRNLDTTRGMTVGESLPVQWVPIARPDLDTSWGEDHPVFVQGWNQGGARFARLEGAWYGDRSIYFHATNGGDAGLGQVWRHRPGRSPDDGGTLTLVFESPSADVLNAPDNVAVSPRGGIVICEDNNAPLIRGLTPDGRIFDFAKNLANDTEFAGACFSPDGETMFVNIMGGQTEENRTPGITLAIWGPWRDGAL